MINHKSATVRLADQIYSESEVMLHKKRPHSSRQTKKQIQNSPFKNMKLKSTRQRSSSAKSLSKQSLKSLKSFNKIAKHLENKTSSLQDLVSKTSQLLIQKKQYEQKIIHFKQKIAFENRKIKQTKQKSGKYRNQIDQYVKRTKKISKQLQQLKNMSTNQRQQSMSTKLLIDQISKEIDMYGLNIEKTKSDCETLEKQIKYLRKQIRNDSHQGSQIKYSLRDSQKRLKHEIITRQQLAYNKASILLQADQIVNAHKK